jgi:hypothetical protein
MNRIIFPSPSYNGAAANRQIHEKISLIKCKLFIYIEKNHISQYKSTTLYNTFVLDIFENYPQNIGQARVEELILDSSVTNKKKAVTGWHCLWRKGENTRSLIEPSNLRRNHPLSVRETLLFPKTSIQSSDMEVNTRKASFFLIH